MAGNVSIRFSVQDEEVVRRALQNLGADGEAALRRLDDAAKRPSQGLSSLDKLIGSLRDRIVGVALSIGPAGSALVALGPGGVAAAAGVGLLVSILQKLSNVANNLADEAIHVREFANAAGLATDQVQALTEAGAAKGLSPEQVQTFVERFSTQVEQLRRGIGELLDQINRVDPALAGQIASARSVAEAWDIVAKAYRDADLAGETFRRNAIARAIGGNRGGLTTGTLLGVSAESGGLDALTASIRNAGGMIDKELIDKLARLRTEIDQTGKDANKIFASIFAEGMLENEKRFAETLLDIAKVAKDFSISPSLEKFIALFDRLPGIWSLIPGGNDARKAMQDALLGGITAGAPTRVNIEVPVGRQTSGDVGRGGQSNPSAEFQLAALRERAAVLGSAITPTEQLTLKQTELNAAIEKNRYLTEFAARALAAFRLAQEQTTVATRERLGIVTQEDLESLRSRELDDQQAKGFIRNAEDRATAEALVAKQIKATLEAQQVRVAQFPGLKQLSIDAADATKSLDKLGVSITNDLVSGLTDIAFSSDGATAGLHRLEQQLARTALQMALQVTIGRAMATIFQGLFGGIPGLGGGTTGSIGRIGANAGGTDSWSGGLTWVGERGPELLNLPGGTRIMPASAIASMASPSIAPGGAGGAVNVGLTFEDHVGGVRAEQTDEKRSGNDVQLRFTLRRIVQEDLSAGHFDPQMGARYGARRPLNVRG